MQARRTKAVKGRKHTAARRGAGKGRSRAHRTELSGSHEEFLLKKLLDSHHSAASRSLILQDLLYSSSPELRVLAFKSGYNLGAEAYRKSPGGTGALQRILENAGMGSIVYYPFESRSTFASRTTRSGGQNLGINIHVFESGIISGYLSAHAGTSVVAEEKSCVFNGASHCMFVARPGSQHAELGASLEFADLLRAARHAIESAEHRHGWEGYCTLESMPLFSEPVFSEMLKFLYLLGKMSASDHLPRPEHEITMAAKFAGIEGAKVRKSKKQGLSIMLEYGHETSVGRFVDLTSAFISGVAKGAYGRSVQASRSLSSKGVYNVRMELLGKKTEWRR
ncbi:MAG: 4-vinyl reductase [Candidatus Marsarchaeota archaeon]|nr:4-vinyl reductase [Candidatus Marsarchaeota archaeon]